MNEKNKFETIVAILEMLLLFLVGILGNKVAELFDFEPVLVGLATIVTLVLLSLITYVRSNNVITQPVDLDERKEGVRFHV